MLVQTDVTPRVELENKLADLTDAQLSMLEQLFPRHIIEYMLAGVPSKTSRNLRDLANTHDRVMVLFADVVGERRFGRAAVGAQRPGLPGCGLQACGCLQLPRVRPVGAAAVAPARLWAACGPLSAHTVAGRAALCPHQAHGVVLRFLRPRRLHQHEQGGGAQPGAASGHAAPV